MEREASHTTKVTRALPSASNHLTVALTPVQLAALAHAVFTDTSARPAVEKNAAEGAVRLLQAEARRQMRGC